LPRLPYSSAAVLATLLYAVRAALPRRFFSSYNDAGITRTLACNMAHFCLHLLLVCQLRLAVPHNAQHLDHNASFASPNAIAHLILPALFMPFCVPSDLHRRRTRILWLPLSAAYCRCLLLYCSCCHSSRMHDLPRRCSHDFTMPFIHLAPAPRIRRIAPFTCRATSHACNIPASCACHYHYHRICCTRTLP